MWCQQCQSIKPCKKVEPSSLNPKYKDGCSGQHWHMAGHKDIQFFRRGRVCQSCGSVEITAETPEIWLHELVRLRNGKALLEGEMLRVNVLHKQCLAAKEKEIETMLEEVAKAREILSAIVSSNIKIEVFQKAS